MSWHYSLELVAAFSEASSLDGEQSAQLKSTGTDGIAFSPCRATEVSSRSRSGTTFGPSTACRGADVLTWFLAAFPVRHIAPPLEAATRLMIFGRKCGESLQRQLPGTYLRRTFQGKRSTQRPTTAKRWVIAPDAFPLERLTWARTTFGNDIGYVHTPTTKANYAAASMQKWPACRAYVQVFGRPNPGVEEWMMGWPEGWSDTQPLGMAKFRSWLQRHGGCCELR